MQKDSKINQIEGQNWVFKQKLEDQTLQNIPHLLRFSRIHCHKCELNKVIITMFGPYRVAADMEGNEEFDFWVIYYNFWRNSRGFREITLL